MFSSPMFPVISLALSVSPTALSDDRTAQPGLDPSTILREAFDIAKTIEKPTTKADVSRELVSALVQEGHIPEAIRAANTIDIAPQRESALLGIAEVQARTGDVHGAIRTALKTTDTLSNRTTTLARIIGIQAKTGDIEGARRNLAAMPQESRHLALWGIAQAQAKSGDLRGAVATLEPVQKDEFARAQSRMLIAEAKLQAGKVDEVRRIAEELRIRPQHIPGTQGARFTDADYYRDRLLSEIAHALVARGDLEGARETAYAISSIRKRVRLLSSIAAVAAKAGDREGGIRIIKQAAGLARGSAGHEPDALELIDLAAAHVVAGDIEASRPMFLQALRCIGPENLHIVPHAQAHAGDVEGALRTAAAIESGVEKSRALEGVAAAQLKSGDVDGASETATSITSAGIRAIVLTRIAEARRMAGDQEDARAAVLEAGRSLEDPAGDAARAVAREWARTGDSSGARRWAHEQKSPAVKARALLGVAEGSSSRAHKGVRNR